MQVLRHPRLPIVLIVAFALLAWWRVSTCGFIWDDDDYVTQNPVLRSWGGLWRIWFEPSSLPQYYPLVHTSFWLECRLWGLAPLGYHLVNVVLHTVSAVLLLRLGRRLALPGALFASLWFLVHPVHVESVAWVTERKNVLSLTCYLLAASCWLRWFDADAAGGRRSYAIGSLLFLCALWSKTVTASLPAALLLVVWWRDGRLVRRAIAGAVPWFVAGASLGWFTVHLEATHVGASGAPWQLEGVERLLVAGRCCWFYLHSLVWPFDTCFNYPRWQVDVGAPLQWLYPIGAVALVVAAWLLRARLGRGPLAVLLIFGGTLVPAIGFFDVYPFRYSFVADHFQYHASVAVLLGLSAWLTRLSARLGDPVRLALAAAWLVANLAATTVAIGAYRDFETLWRQTLHENPESALSLVNLGALSLEAGDFATARAQLERVLELDPDNDEAHNNLGKIAYEDGDHAAAIRHFERALELNPRETAAVANLAIVHTEDGEARAALTLLERALQEDSDSLPLLRARGRALLELGEWRAAVADFDAVLRSDPADFAALRWSARCHHQLGAYARAAGIAGALLRRDGSDEQARELLVAAVAPLLRDADPVQIRAAATDALQRQGLEAAPLLPRLAVALRQLGAAPQAEALER